MNIIAWVNGREIRETKDGYGLFADDIMIAGPFQTKEKALIEAIRLPADRVTP